jgi:hypothetical protein
MSSGSGTSPAATFGFDTVFSDRALEILTVDGRATYADDTKNAWGAARVRNRSATPALSRWRRDV